MERASSSRRPSCRHYQPSESNGQANQDPSAQARRRHSNTSCAHDKPRAFARARSAMLLCVVRPRVAVVGNLARQSQHTASRVRGRTRQRRSHHAQILGRARRRCASPRCLRDASAITCGSKKPSKRSEFLSKNVLVRRWLTIRAGGSAMIGKRAEPCSLCPVSYTHLTLPTKA